MNRRRVRAGELGRFLGRELEGDPERILEGAAALEDAGPEDLVFVRSERFAGALAQSRAGAVVAPPGIAIADRTVIRSPRPDLDFARAVAWAWGPQPPEPGVHPSAFVAPEADVHPEASVGPRAVVQGSCRVGARTVLHAGAVLYPDVEVGEDCVLHAGVVVREGTRLGNRVVLQPGVVLGGDGFGFTLDEKGAWIKLPQLGRVVIEDDVEIGANTTVDRATLSETRIRAGAKLDNLIQIGHNCDIGLHAIIVAQCGLSGSTRVGARAILMGQVGTGGHLTIGEGAFVGGRAGIHRDVAPGSRVWGVPQMEERRWHRAMAALGRLPEALRRLRAVERRLGIAPSRGDPGER